jgi:hypothetical protein
MPIILMNMLVSLTFSFYKVFVLNV